MKKNLFFFIFLGLSLNLFSQPTIKVFAFEQENLPGTKPAAVTDENGNPVQKVAAEKDYFIFLSFNKKYTITPTQLFIKGRPFAVKNNVVKKTPVQFINNNIPSKPEKITLVPATNNKVIDVRLSDKQSEIKKTAALQKLTDKNEVVIVYVWKSKKYFLPFKKLEKLAPVANE